MCDYNDSDVLQNWFAYDNYIDEVLVIAADANTANTRYFVHDHLYSPAALVSAGRTVLERYEYDAYGECSVLEPNFAADADNKSDYGNLYLFTASRLDILDSGSLIILMMSLNTTRTKK